MTATTPAGRLAERLRPTVRMRLTLVYGGLFLAAGVVLLALTYILVQNNLRPSGEPQEVGHRQSAPAGQAGEAGAAGPELAATQTRDMIFQAPPEKLIPAGEAQVVLYKAKKDYERETLNSILTQGGIALGVVGAAALGLGWILADRALRPVHKITETAGRVARSHDLTERIEYDGPRDDVRELADAFDTMLRRLARAFDGQRRFVANASHELRTPLAINRTLVDVALRRPDATEDVRRLGSSLLVVNARHERLIDGLLTLAGSENAVIDASSLDLADVAGHVLDQAAAEASARGITASRSLGRAPATGDPVLLERLVQNLVENAIRHNHEDGELTVTTRAAGGWAELVVTNSGPVVPAYGLETIFEPFRRLGNDRVHSERGSGLGLSIVRATATAHGGGVTAKARPEGGLTLTVQLPQAGHRRSPRGRITRPSRPAARAAEGGQEA